MNMPQFTADASLYRTNRHYQLTAVLAADNCGRVSPALVGRWSLPGIPCQLSCIEVCTRFCRPTGWECCNWETRCVLKCERLGYEVDSLGHQGAGG
jgi:hypothetical protein